MDFADISRRRAAAPAVCDKSKNERQTVSAVPFGVV